LTYIVLLSLPSKLFPIQQATNLVIISSSSSSTGAIVRSATSREPAIAATTTPTITPTITVAYTTGTFSLASFRNTTVWAGNIRGKFLAASVFIDLNIILDLLSIYYARKNKN
jgi:hypothetical protein